MTSLSSTKLQTIVKEFFTGPSDLSHRTEWEREKAAEDLRIIAGRLEASVREDKRKRGAL